MKVKPWHLDTLLNLKGVVDQVETASICDQRSTWGVKGGQWITGYGILRQLTTIVSEFDPMAPGLVATTVPGPAVARSLAGMATVTCAESTIVVVR